MLGRGRRVAGAVAIAALLGAAAFAGYRQIVTTHAAYDDEGYFMLSLASSLDGKALYDEVYTQYGPAPFLLAGAFHRLTGLPVSHDVTRMKTLAVWLVAAVLSACLVVRATGTRALWPAAFLAAFFHLERLTLEPGHPQEICVLGLLAVPLLLLTAAARSGTPAWLAAALGLVVASVVMTKLNVGIFLLATTGLTLLVLGPRDRWARARLAVCAFVVMLLPFVLVRAHLRAPSGTTLPVLVAGSTLATLLVAVGDRGAPRFGWSGLAAFAASTAVVIVAWMLLAIGRGTSLAGLWSGLVGQHEGFALHFASPAPLHALAVPWTAIGVLSAMRARRDPRIVGAARVVAIGALVACCVRQLPETFTPLVHGADDRGAAGLLAGLATPALWVLLIPRDAGAGAARLALALAGSVQILGAYPTPGTQMAVGSLATLLGCLVVLDDAVRRVPWLRRVATVAVTALLLTTLGARDVRFQARWASLARLRLPGARLLRMERRDVASHRWLVRTLRAQTQTFVFAEHARDSLYFWTRLAPPTAKSPTFWPFMLSAADQERIVAVLERTDRVGVVSEAYGGTLPTDSPLRAYVAAHFRPAVTDGHFHVWLRR